MLLNRTCAQKVQVGASGQGLTAADAPRSTPVPAQRDNRHQDVVTARQAGAGQVGFTGTERIQPNINTAEIPSPQESLHRPVSTGKGGGGLDARAQSRRHQWAEPNLLSWYVVQN